MARKIGPFPTAEEMREYYDGMVARRLSSARLGNTIKMFKHWTRYAECEMPDVKAPPDTNRRLVYLTELEAAKLLHACTDKRDYALLCVMLYGGVKIRIVCINNYLL